MGHRGKGKRLRARSYISKEKLIEKRRMKTNKFERSGWKIKKYPDIFKVINYFPYIVRRDDKRYK